MSNVTKIRKDAPLSVEQGVAEVMAEYSRGMAILGVDIDAEQDDE